MKPPGRVRRLVDLLVGDAGKGVNTFVAKILALVLHSIRWHLPRMDIELAFANVEARAQSLRMTIPEMLIEAGIKRHTYWRARKGLHAKLDSRIRVVRELENKLSEMEATA